MLFCDQTSLTKVKWKCKLTHWKGCSLSAQTQSSYSLEEESADEEKNHINTSGFCIWTTVTMMIKNWALCFNIISKKKIVETNLYNWFCEILRIKYDYTDLEQTLNEPLLFLEGKKKGIIQLHHLYYTATCIECIQGNRCQDVMLFNYSFVIFFYIYIALCQYSSKKQIFFL